MAALSDTDKAVQRVRTLDPHDLRTKDFTLWFWMHSDDPMLGAYDKAALDAVALCRSSAWNIPGFLARRAVIALHAWPDSRLMLDLPPEAVRTLGCAGNKPALLLYPICVLLNEQKE